MIKSKAAEIVDIVKSEDKQYKVIFLRHLNCHIRGSQFAVLEVKLENDKQASDF